MKIKIKNGQCKRLAQQLVEFLLVAPFLAIILGILTEYAYALNVNMTLSQGIKTSTASIYHQIRPNMADDEVRSLVLRELRRYLRANNVPTAGENNIKVESVTYNNTTVFIASYTYVPAFTLPNVYFHFMPDKFYFHANSAVPSAFLATNPYDDAIDSIALDNIWAATASFSSLDEFDDSKKGIMNSKKSDSVNMLFLVPVSAPIPHAYALVSWDGTPSMNGALYKIFNSGDGFVHKCSYLSCVSTGSALSTTGYSSVIFVHDAGIPAGTNLIPLSAGSLDLKLLSQWIIPSSSTDKISSLSVDGVLKRTLALVVPGGGGAGQSVGNYDNLSVTGYNPDVSPSGNTYTVSVKGLNNPVVIIKTAADDDSKITVN